MTWFCKKEPDRVSVSKPDTKLVWCPFAEQRKPDMVTRGNYRKGYPEGAIVHYSAGAYGLSGMDFGQKQGYAFMFIDFDGTIYQSAPLDRWGYHAGESSWPALGTGVSQYLVGIEVACAGILTRTSVTPPKYKTWFNTTVAAEDTFLVPTTIQNMVAGVYQRYTPAQYTALLTLLLWLKRNNPSVFSFDLVLGHDEVSPGRKTDPGGSLTMTMRDFRARLFIAESTGAQV